MSQHVPDIATIIFCESDEATLDLICEHLSADRFEVLPASRAADALWLCRYNHPDILLLDLALPRRTGLDVIREIRESDGVESRLDPNLPIIVLGSNSPTPPLQLEQIVEGFAPASGVLHSLHGNLTGAFWPVGRPRVALVTRSMGQRPSSSVEAMRAFLALSLVAICLAGCGGGSPQGDRGPYYALRNLYCSYEYRSKAEVKMCLHEITPKLIVLSSTPAARFAKSLGKAECGRGAGPLCADAKREAQQP